MTDEKSDAGAVNTNETQAAAQSPGITLTRLDASFTEAVEAPSTLPAKDAPALKAFRTTLTSGDLRTTAMMMGQGYSANEIAGYSGVHPRIAQERIQKVLNAADADSRDAFYVKMGVTPPALPAPEQKVVAAPAAAAPKAQENGSAPGDQPVPAAAETPAPPPQAPAKPQTLADIIARLEAQKPPHLEDLKTIATGLAQGLSNAVIAIRGRIHINSMSSRNRQLYEAVGVVNRKEFLALLGGPKKGLANYRAAPLAAASTSQGSSAGAGKTPPPPPALNLAAMKKADIEAAYARLTPTQRAFVDAAIDDGIRTTATFAKDVERDAGEVAAEVNLKGLLAQFEVDKVADLAKKMNGVSRKFNGKAPESATRASVAPAASAVPAAKPKPAFTELENQIMQAAANPACNNYNSLIDAVDPSGANLSHAELQQAVGEICGKMGIQKAPVRNGENATYLGGLIHNLRGTTPPPAPVRAVASLGAHPHVH